MPSHVKCEIPSDSRTSLRRLLPFSEAIHCLESPKIKATECIEQSESDIMRNDAAVEEERGDREKMGHCLFHLAESFALLQKKTKAGKRRKIE